MRVLFLDIDGVLNNDSSFREFGKFGRGPMPGEAPTRDMLAWCSLAVARLRRIVARTRCQIVICSSWRGYESRARPRWQAMFACYNWANAPIIGETPDLRRARRPDDYVEVPEVRGVEVSAWLYQNPEYTRYVCLDDNPSWYQRGQPVVRTWQEQGLQDEQVEQCIEILMRQEI